MSRRPERPPPTLSDLRELRASLAAAGVADVPEAQAGRERDLLGVLAFAGFFLRRRKDVRFPRAWRWEEPAFDVVDQKLTVRAIYAQLEGFADLAALLEDEARRARERPEPVLLLLDALDAEAPEYELEHALYGEVTYFPWPGRPPEIGDARVAQARDRGWSET